MLPSALKDAIDAHALRRVLVIKLRHHGDVLLTSPVLSALKALAPAAEIDALVYADTAPMLSLHPALTTLHTIDRGWKKAGLARQLREETRLFFALRARRFDLIVHLTDHPRGAWLTRLLQGRWSVAPIKPSGGAFWAESFSHLYPGALRGRHTVDTHLDALRRLGLTPPEHSRALTLVPGEAALARVASLLQTHQLTAGEFVVLHPASRWLFKCWPVARNAELIRTLHARGLKVVLTAAPDARETAMVQDILAHAGVPATNLAGQLSLKELAALIGHARLFVGVDSAPMHIAAACGTPCVVLFGPSGDKEWAPWRVRHEIIASPAHACRPCGQDGCGGSKVAECLTSLPVTTVLAAIDRLLAPAEAA